MRRGSLAVIVLAFALTADAGERLGALDLRVAAARLPRGAQVRVTVSSDAHPGTSAVLRARDLRFKTSLPDGTYSITVEAPHYRKVVRSVRIAGKTEVVSVVLEPLPVLSGRVFERGSSLGLPGAVIATSAETKVITDGTGAWSMELEPDRWPETLTVSAAGYADTTVAVPRARASARLEDAFLNRGASVSITVTAADDVRVRRVELQTLASGKWVAKPFKSVAIDENVRPIEVRFDRIEPGRYAVIAAGDGPFERRGEIVEVREGEEKPVALSVAPMQLRLRTALGGEPLPAAEVTLDLEEGGWRGLVETDAKGEAIVALWQSGRAFFMVRSEGRLTIPHFDSGTLPEEEEIDWSIDIPARSVAGTVVDAKTGAPIVDAPVSLKADGTESGVGFGVRTRTDSAGRFRFVPVPYGRLTLYTGSRTHQEATLTFTFAPPEESRDIAIRLEGGSMVRLRVLDATGTPVVRAIALQYDRGLLKRMSVTDDAGLAEVLVPDRSTLDVWIVPRDGSFGVTSVAAEPSTPTLRLAAGTSRIDLRAESDAGEPIPNVSVAMHYGGLRVPDEVMNHFARIQGAWTISRADGRLLFLHMPPGRYEFRPAGSSGGATASMNVLPGDNKAVLTLTRSR